MPTQIQSQNHFSPIRFLNEKIEFSTNLFKPQKIKSVSQETITFSPYEDTSAKTIALKAPKIKIQSLLSASKKLVIHTDLLIINGGYITKPQKWDIQASRVKIINTNTETQWITKLIENKAISSSNFNSAADPDCNFDIPIKPSFQDRISDIQDEIREIKDKFKRWLH